MSTLARSILFGLTLTLACALPALAEARPLLPAPPPARPAHPHPLPRRAWQALIASRPASPDPNLHLIPVRPGAEAQQAPSLLLVPGCRF